MRFVIILSFLAIVCTGCVGAEQFEQVQVENQELGVKIADLQSEIESLNKTIAELESDVEKALGDEILVLVSRNSMYYYCLSQEDRYIEGASKKAEEACAEFLGENFDMVWRSAGLEIVNSDYSGMSGIVFGEN